MLTASDNVYCLLPIMKGIRFMSPIWEAKRGSHNLKTMRNFRFLISVMSSLWLNT